MPTFKPSQNTQEKIAAFELADQLFKAELDKFEREYELRLQALDHMRQDRNVKLDEAKRALRAETESLDDMRLTYSSGPFKVQKKWSDFYIPEKLVSMLGDRGLYDQALSAGIIAIKTEVAKFEQVHKFLEENGVTKDFECCEDGEESTVAISGPKTIPPFGMELKKE